MSPDKPSPESPKEKRSRVGGYEIIARLGQGGMGAVFKARQISIDRVVALKILPPRLAKNKEYVARFFREARAAGKLNHPNIVQAIDAGVADGYHYFAMEFVEGQSVAERLKGDRLLPERPALEIARDIGRAINYAHEAGIIHRDIKPGNILLAPDGPAKLADLGLARETTSKPTDLTQAGYAIGTPDYISPEQVRGEADLDGRTDVYSLGATLFHMLVGRPPYAGGTGNEVMAKHLAEPIPNVHKANPELSHAVARVIWKAMAKDREKRYQTAAEFVSDIERVLAGTAATAPARAVAPTAQPPAAPATSRGKARYVVASLAVAVPLIILIAVLSQSQNGGPDGNGGGPTTGPGIGTGKTADLRALEGLRSWVKQHPQEYRKAIAKYNDAIRRMTDAALRGQATADLDALKAKLARAVDKALEAAEKEANRLADKSDYDGAIAAYQRVPAAFADLLAAQVNTAVNALRRAAESRINAAVTAAENCSRTRKPDKGLAELEKLKDVKYAALAARVRALRARLEAEKRKLALDGQDRALVEAKRTLDKLLTDIESAAMRDDLEEPLRLAEAALKDDKLRLVAAPLERVVAVAQALGNAGAVRKASSLPGLKEAVGRKDSFATTKPGLGTVTGVLKEVTDDAIVVEKTYQISGQVKRRTYRIRIADLTPATLRRFKPKWVPKTADEHIAAAILALATTDRGRMETALKNAERHPLHARYAQKLTALKREAIELAAKRDWEAIKRYDTKRITKQKLTKREATTIPKLLDGFERTHRRTRFAASLKENIRLLRAYCIPVYTKWPFTATEAKRRQKETAEVLGIPVARPIKLSARTGLEFVLIPAGEFIMGSHSSEPMRNQREGPQRRVRLTTPYYIGQHHVTQLQWQEVMGNNPSQSKGLKNPVEKVSWHDAQAFVQKLSALGKGTFRLPTEAEWEYACRAGTATPFYCGETISTDRANYDGNSTYGKGKKGVFRKKTTPVGSFPPNPLGLHDMHGNVYDWCQDWAGAYNAQDWTDPRGPAAGTSRIVRGGAWLSQARWSRSAWRWSLEPRKNENFIGLRPVLSIEAP